MGKKLATPKKGDLVVCIKGGFVGRYFGFVQVNKGDLGVVTFTRRNPNPNNGGHLTIMWTNCTTSKCYLEGKWADSDSGWTQYLRVIS